ncbi:TAXI family TRAP transporter solute-binding subunit [Alkalilimnicola sp. S0819]|uniref:TAXI family TRAP transporter solute-binding subunit n=1 Tax=Alkalilimnicola sp. S0819 TaxID=2613922 RepID=UPI00126210D9|nr:TAXI family TRAP transporter solute-binding subunit [Alkalilimnicola sp. S0819]KAB7624002.1 TAXI family TRAP transporter solute-binding subunit [Alkalilimnicola sp. S0819]MPQ16609.1 TAXI family TRAP transporter solute-binding subunit [Alkalilimnicola sp. S0819]
MKLNRTLLKTVAAGAALALSVSAAAEERVRLLTAPTGSIVHTTGSAIASVGSRHTDMTVLAAPMSGPQVYVPQVNNGQAEFTLMNAADSYNALRGGTGYRTPQKNLRVAAVGFTNELGIIVNRDSDIRSAEDLRGRRVTGVFSAHKTCEQLGTAQLANLGLSWDDVQVVPVTHSRTAVQALADGRAEVAMCVPLGQAIVQEVNASKPIRFLSLNDSAEAVKATRAHFPAGVIRAYKEGANVGVLSDINVWSYPFYLVAGADASDDAVYKLVKAIYENVDQLREVSGVFKRWIPEQMVNAELTLPVHEGARRFYEEKGMWSTAVEASHQENLKAAQ